MSLTQLYNVDEDHYFPTLIFTSAAWVLDIKGTHQTEAPRLTVAQYDRVGAQSSLVLASLTSA